MSKYRNLDNRKHYGVSVEPAQFWCIEYLEMLQPKKKGELVEEAIKTALERIDLKGEIPKKPPTPKKGMRLDWRMERNIEIAIRMIKINNGLVNWGVADTVRYGLKITLNHYAKRFPEMEKVVRKYEDK